MPFSRTHLTPPACKDKTCKPSVKSTHARQQHLDFNLRQRVLLSCALIPQGIEWLLCISCYAIRTCNSARHESRGSRISTSSRLKPQHWDGSAVPGTRSQVSWYAADAESGSSSWRMSGVTKVMRPTSGLPGGSKSISRYQVDRSPSTCNVAILAVHVQVGK